ncbi:hypothetical protein BHM03_00016626 [Ensete ventricosum]|nr:hypothetical protein BHM03_00016626 [Ensete ventricosum]
MVEVAGDLDYFSAHIRLREPDKSEDKAECKATDSRTMGLAAPWYRRGGTSMESSIPCSHGGRALVVKGAEEVENAKAISKYQDKAKGQRPRNFIKLVSTIVLNRRSGARLSARTRRGEARAPRSTPRRHASMRRRLGARPSPGDGQFGRAPGLI